LNSKHYIFLLLTLLGFISTAQNNKIYIDATLDFQKKEIQIQQKIVYYNTANRNLDTLYFHNWANSYKDKNTPLSKRLLEDYDKSLYFAKNKKRGFSNINKIANNQHTLQWKTLKNKPDIIQVILNKSLNTKDSILLHFNYTVKIPDAKFTHYGNNKNTYNLRYWYITPAVLNKQWQLMSNFNMDDLHIDFADYNINFTLPQGVHINTDLNLSKTKTRTKTTYHLKGNNRTDIELNISLINNFKLLKVEKTDILTNLHKTSLNLEIKTSVLAREVAFIEGYLGAYPHQKLLINKITYDKNPIYGLNQLPKFFNPFSGVFEWDIKMFKALSKKYIENTLNTNKRTDAWITDGIQTYLMIKYVDKYYPEVKAMGTISKIWGFKSYQLARLNFNDKYTFVNQFAMRKNLDQPLTMQADSLSTFNRKIVNKYKAGIGLIYLDTYLGDSIIPQSIKQFYTDTKLQKSTSKQFEKILSSKTTKDLQWFFTDYLQTHKKMDYTIKRVKTTQDSIQITIKNKRKFTAPIALYGIKNGNTIQFKKWFTAIDSTRTVKIAKGDFSRLSLNYENNYPELNLNNNWKNLKPSLLNRPVLLRFIKDIDNPYYNQIFYNFEYDYNYYDGLLLGGTLSNKTLFKKEWTYKIRPTYGTTSKKLTGSISLLYQHLPEDGPIYRLSSGIGANFFHYAPNLSYKSLRPFVGISFKRKSLRDVGGSSLFARYIYIDKEIAPNTTTSEADNYGIFNISYGYSKPDILKDLRYVFNFQLGGKFSKITADYRYRKLSNTQRQYDFRAYFGSFLHNNTTSTYFNFALDRPTDYMFDYNFLGRSEASGFLSQQIIIAEGGFKSKFANPYANQWMLSTNGSASIWRWIEVYADAAFYKNQNTSPLFRYDSGIRLNFVHNFFEVYFPIQSSLGFEPNQAHYSSKIRFVITLSPGRIYNFIKRGFY